MNMNNKRFLVLSLPLVVIIYAVIINYANENNWITLHILLAITAFISVFSVWQIKSKSYFKKTTGINKKDRLSIISKILFVIMSLTFLIIFLASVESIITGTEYYQGDCVTRYSQNNGKGGGWTLKISDQGINKNINITANEAKLLTGTNNTFDSLEYKCTTGVKITYLKNLGIRIKLEKIK